MNVVPVWLGFVPMNTAANRFLLSSMCPLVDRSRLMKSLFRFERELLLKTALTRMVVLPHTTVFVLEMMVLFGLSLILMNRTLLLRTWQLTMLVAWCLDGGGVVGSTVGRVVDNLVVPVTGTYLVKLVC